jgi:hypothetical protein
MFATTTAVAASAGGLSAAFDVDRVIDQVRFDILIHNIDVIISWLPRRL